MSVRHRERPSPPVRTFAAWIGAVALIAAVAWVAVDGLLAALVIPAAAVSFRQQHGAISRIEVAQGMVRAGGGIEVPARDVIGAQVHEGRAAVRAAREPYSDLDVRRHCPSYMPSALEIETRSAEGIDNRLLLGTRDLEVLRAAVGSAMDAPPFAEEPAPGPGSGSGSGRMGWRPTSKLAVLVLVTFAIGLPALLDGEPWLVLATLLWPLAVAVSARRRVSIEGEALRFGGVRIPVTAMRSVRATSMGEARYLAHQGSLMPPRGRVRLPEWSPPRALVITVHPREGGFMELSGRDVLRHTYLLACEGADGLAVELRSRTGSR